MAYLNTPVPVVQGGTGLSTTNANGIIYSSSDDVIGQITGANGGVLTTDPSTGVPSIDTTNFARLTTGMQVRGNNTNTTPPAGFIGEQIRSQVAEASVSLALSGSFYTVVSISLTPGIWDVSFVCKITQPGAGTVTRVSAGIATATNSNTGWVQGDNAGDGDPPLFNAYGKLITVPTYRVLVSSTTSYFLTAGAVFASGSYAAGGRISAVRVG